MQSREVDKHVGELLSGTFGRFYDEEPYYFREDGQLRNPWLRKHDRCGATTARLESAVTQCIEGGPLSRMWARLRMQVVLRIELHPNEIICLRLLRHCNDDAPPPYGAHSTQASSTVFSPRLLVFAETTSSLSLRI